MVTPGPQFDPATGATVGMPNDEEGTVGVSRQPGTLEGTELAVGANERNRASAPSAVPSSFATATPPTETTLGSVVSKAAGKWHRASRESFPADATIRVRARNAAIAGCICESLQDPAAYPPELIFTTS